MARDSSGTKNQPQYSGSGAPATAADQSEIANYAAEVGNTKALTSAQRLALTGADLWDGLAVRETDTGWIYVRISGSWVVWSTPWTAYTPTLTNMAGAVAAFFQILAGTVQVRFRITLSAVVGTTPSFTLPVNASDTDVEFPAGQVMLLDSSASTYWPGIARRATAGECVLWAQSASGTYTQMISLTAAAPFAWASGDVISANFSYRSA